MEAAGKDKYDPDDKGKPITEQCPGEDDGNWYDVWRIGETDGY